MKEIAYKDLFGIGKKVKFWNRVLVCVSLDNSFADTHILHRVKVRIDPLPLQRLLEMAGR